VASSDGSIAQSGAQVDLALVLAVDCSSSVDSTDFQLQMEGIAAALRHPSLSDAIGLGRYGRIALAMVQWSSRNGQFVALDWQILANGPQLAAAAQAVDQTERLWQPGGTGLAAAVDFCAAYLASRPVVADRLVIDVSGDGEDNDGGDVPAARDRALFQGITINGLPIMSGSQRIVGYYQERVIGGPDSFLVPAKDIWAFQDAILRKLLREVSQRIS
jgi:hypothetical protein